MKAVDIKNRNQLAQCLCKREGGKEQVNIAQMKQVMKKLKKLIKVNPKILILFLK